MILGSNAQHRLQQNFRQCFTALPASAAVAVGGFVRHDVLHDLDLLRVRQIVGELTDSSHHRFLEGFLLGAVVRVKFYLEAKLSQFRTVTYLRIGGVTTGVLDGRMQHLEKCLENAEHGRTDGLRGGQHHGLRDHFHHGGADRGLGGLMAGDVFHEEFDNTVRELGNLKTRQLKNSFFHGAKA